MISIRGSTLRGSPLRALDELAPVNTVKDWLIRSLTVIMEGDSVNDVVRRPPQTLALAENGADLLPQKTHRAAGIVVRSQVRLAIEPKLYLSWMVQPSYWTKGFTLLVFHSTTGFSPEKYPDDLNRHGQLVIETVQDACREVRPDEGTHYYTFLLHRKCLLGLSEKLSVVRFSETIPSARVAIGRIKNKLELEELFRRHELGGIEHEAKLSEAEMRRIRAGENLAEAQDPSKKKVTGADAIIADELAGIDATVEALLAKRQKIEELKRDPKFKKLSRKDRDAIIERIEERLAAAEISARREMRGS